jgi:phenylpropionate dioxygenase-like ring-hydroxylating dioxygenase large terminal subunit
MHIACSAPLQLHSVDERAEQTACASGRACAASFPTQVAQGLVWVWGESGGLAFVDSTQRQPQLNPLKAATDPGMRCCWAASRHPPCCNSSLLLGPMRHVLLSLVFTS